MAKGDLRESVGAEGVLRSDGRGEHVGFGGFGHI